MNDRYQRQIRLANFGQTGQKALLETKVLIVGCGGLGCPVALYLTRGGVRQIGLADGDKVDLTNLHRQVLYTESSVGDLKVHAAKEALLNGDEELEIDVYPTRLQKTNYEEIFVQYDVIVDCTDNFEARYLINDACVILGKPLVYGAANGWEGQVAVFNLKNSGNLRDIFPEVPNQGIIQNCEEAGVLGVTTGIIGNMMAMEVIKVATNIGTPLVNQFVQYDAESNQYHSIKYKPNTSRLEIKIEGNAQISWGEYYRDYNEALLVDVHSSEERSIEPVESVHMPLSRVSNEASTLDWRKQVVFFCATGKRATEAATITRNELGKESLVIIGKLG